jgi:uncharacterized protein with HEPN domain
MRDDAERLRDMLEAIVNIEKYASKGQQSYLTDELIQVWIVHHIQIIGEAAANLSSSLRDRYPDILWTDTDLPILKSQITGILSQLDENR